MKAPESLETLLDYGIIQEVVRPLMSGKEAQVYVVVSGGEECVAKVYKEANQRTFKHRSDYTEGRRTRNSRDQRAMSKRTQHGRKKDEDAWRSTEVEMIYRLRDAGVRVPEPINFVEGVLVMELVKDTEGHAAPRLGDLTYSPSEARDIYQKLISEVVRMLCAGVIHGDLSEFNVLMSRDGPVVIDFPQSIDPTQNPNSQKLLLRDVDNLHRFLARFAPDEPVLPYGEEIWSLFLANRLRSDTKLTGRYAAPQGTTDTAEVMALIEDANFDERKRRGGLDLDEDDETSVGTLVKASVPFRKVVDFSRESTTRPPSRKSAEDDGSTAAPRRRRRASNKTASSAPPAPPKGPASGSVAPVDATPSRRRPRRGGKSAPEPRREAGNREPRSEPTTVSAAESAKPAGLQNRRRRRRSRGQSDAKASSEGPKSSRDAGGTKTGRAGEMPVVPNGAKRPSNSATSSRSTQAPRERAGTDRPTRRRRRRPRNASAPK
jgi:RIO kinase 1